MTVAMTYYLFKSEPRVYSFDNLLRDGETGWDGDIHVLCLCLGDYGPLMLSRFC